MKFSAWDFFHRRGLNKPRKGNCHRRKIFRKYEFRRLKRVIDHLFTPNPIMEYLKGKKSD